METPDKKGDRQDAEASSSADPPPPQVTAEAPAGQPALDAIPVAQAAPSLLKTTDDAGALMSAQDAETAGVDEESVALRGALKELLDRFGIESAVIVDDEAYDVALSDVVALVEVHKDAAREALGAIGAQLNLEVPELWREDLGREWDRLRPVERVALFGRLAPLSGDAARTHARFAAGVRDLLPVPCTVLQPADWAIREDEFVKSAIKPSPSGTGERCHTLLLFDLDLHKADLGDAGGATLVLNVLAKYPNVDVLCGIISSQVRADDEGAVLVNAPAGFEHERVVRISKADIPEKPWQFAYGVKRALLAPHLVKMRQTADQIIGQAHEAATNRLKKIEVYDLVYAVITRSDEEGVRDFETFFRVHEVFYQDELRRLAHASVPLGAAASELREVSALAQRASKPTDRRTWEIQRREIYDNDRDLNTLHLPIELGDVFACDNRGGGSTEFVLLSQPCDLMVRTRNGKRRVDQALVAQISHTAPEKLDGESLASFRLPYYLEGGKDAWVKFAKHYTVPLWTLDLCVLNDSGRAICHVNAALPAALSGAWVKRAGLVRSDVERFVKRVVPAPGQESGKKKREAAEPAMIPLLDRLLAHPFVVAKAQLTPLALEVGCQRVQRVLRPYAADMLTKFGHYLSRTAFEVDLGEGTL
jgi:hypothetical protein